MDRLINLLSPLTIETMELANRVVLAPMGTGLGNPYGTVSEANLAYLKRIARGGPGIR